MVTFDDTLLLAALIAALAEWGAHYFPWHRVFKRPLTAPWTYVIGLLLLGLPFLFVCVRRQHWGALITALLIVIAGGGAVLLAYFVDWVLELHAQKQDWQDRATVYGKDR